MQRRLFLAAAAASSAHAAPRRVRIAFLGGSHSHGFAKARIVSESPDWDLAGVCEEDPGLRRKYEEARIPLISAADALAAGVEVVAIESAVKDHYSQCRAALEARKHVHVEKPPADTMEGMRELVKLAGRHGRLLQSGYMWRYHPGVNRVIEAVRQGWLGDVYLVRGVIDTAVGPEARLQNAAFRGGMMFELGSHMIDSIVRMMGRPDRVTPFLKRTGASADTLADNTLAVFEYPRALAMVQSATPRLNSGSHRRLEVCGTRGNAIIQPMEPPRLTIELAEAAGPYQKGVQSVTLPPYQRYVDDLRELAAAVRGEGKLTVSLEGELLVQETLLRACGVIA